MKDLTTSQIGLIWWIGDCDITRFHRTVTHEWAMMYSRSKVETVHVCQILMPMTILLHLVEDVKEPCL